MNHGSLGTAPGTTGPLPTLALGMPDRTSWLILSGFLVALVALIWLLARVVRKQGGFRKACRRLAWELRMTARAFTAPLRAYRRHRRSARTLAAFFADPSAYDMARAALDAADAESGAGCYAPAVRLDPARDRARVVVAGRDPVGSGGPARPWADAAAEPGEWTWSAPAAALASTASSGRARLLLVLGVDRAEPGTVLVDWLRGPAALTVEGDARVSRSVLQSLAAQLDRMPDGPAVRVASGVHPRFPGAALEDLLAELTDATADAAADATAHAGSVPASPDLRKRSTDAGGSADADAAAADAAPVVVCWAPTPQQAARLAELCAAGRIRALVGGRFPGNCWTLHAEPDGRLLGPGPRVDVESPALSRAVARTVRRAGPAPRRLAPVPPGTPPPGSAHPGAPAPEASTDTEASPAATTASARSAAARDTVNATGPTRQHRTPHDASAAADFTEPGGAASDGAGPGPGGGDDAERGSASPVASSRTTTGLAGTDGCEADGVHRAAPDRSAPGPDEFAEGRGAGAGTGSRATPAAATRAEAEPDLSEPIAGPGRTGPVGVSAAGGASFEPGATGDSKERTPRNP